MTRAGGLAAALLLCAAAPAAAQELGPYFLAGLEVDAAPGLSLDGPVQVTLELHPGARAADLREWFPAAAIRQGAVTVRLGADRGRARPTPAQRGPTFLVDSDQPAVIALRAGIERAAGPSPSADDLAAFVDGWIERKGWGRLLDPASTVAVRREGDCTEHAVLLAAVARLFGRPSRVVVGLALAQVDGRTLALGHAWAELHDGGRWVPADAAARGLGVPVHRLPLGVLADEGPGYGSAAARVLSPGSVRRVRLTRGR